MLIPTQKFQSLTGLTLNRGYSQVEAVVSLREIHSIVEISLMSNDYLKALLSNVSLLENPSIKPYNDCEIYRCRVDPSDLMLGQKFVMRDKILSILDNMQTLLNSGGFSLGGFAKIQPLVVYGQMKGNTEDLFAAFYIPPIVEELGSGKVLLDGTHRLYMAKGVGTTVEVVVIKNPKTEIPFTPHSWNVKQFEVKPPKEERYLDLKPRFFRNLTGIGIDG